MHDPRIDQLATLLVNYSVSIRKGDIVLLIGPPSAEPAIAATYREVLKAGGYPWTQFRSELCGEYLLKHGSDAQIAYTHPFDRYLMNNCNARIVFLAEENTKALSNVDPAKQALANKARKPLLNVMLKRAALPKKDPKRLRWTGTIFPNQAFAQDAEMSLSEYEDFVYKAGKFDQPNPIAAWKRAGVAQQRLADFLNKANQLHVKARGTDIRFGIRGRKWINCDGHENFPDGEVFTAPIEDATEGTVQYSFPAAVSGREVDGIRLVFKAGRVVEASAAKNEEFLLKMLDQDKGARILGELALGTNYGIKRHTKNILFDEKIGGTFHAALGAAYPESGGTNTSGLHWDMICDLRKGGVVTVDGQVISRNGKFTNPRWPG